MKILAWVGGIVSVLIFGVFLWTFSLFAGWFVPKYSPEALTALLAPSIQIRKPDGEGPFPAFVQFHGCAGLRDNQYLWADLAVEEGYMAIMVDSFKPRGLDNDAAVEKICSGRHFIGLERAGDILSSLDYVRELKDVDPNKIVLAGWSHGAYSLMDLLAMDLDKTRPTNLSSVPSQGMEGVVGAFLVYPYCGLASLTRRAGWSTSVPSLMLVAENDQVVDAAACINRAQVLQENGHPLELIVLEGAFHMFDYEQFPKYYSERAMAQADAALRNFLRARRVEPIASDE